MQTTRYRILEIMQEQGDVTVGKGLLKTAIDTHPQHFEAAVRSLEALGS